MPNAISARPRTTRNHDAQVGGDLRSPSSAPDDEAKIAVSAHNPNTQLPRNASPVGRGRGVCSTSTAGMIDSGEIEMTNASGMSVVSAEPKLVVTG